MSELISRTELKLPKVVWNPLRGIPEIGASSQFFGYTVEANEILLHGTRGSGKTALHLMRFARGLNRGWGQAWKGAMIARKYRGLQDIEAQSKKFFYHLGGRYLSSASEKKWVFPKGEVLLFTYVEKESGFGDKFLGQEFSWIGFNELTLFTQDIYNLVKTSNRCAFVPEQDTPRLLNMYGEPMFSESGEPLYDTLDRKIAPPVNLEVCSTTNSYGPCRSWVKREFIDVAPAGVPYDVTAEVAGEKTTIRKIHLFSSWLENIQKYGGFLPNTYILTLKESCRGNKNREKSWIEGSWDISSGGIFDDIWDSKVHVMKRFKIPSRWRIFRSMDWGSSQPFCVQWWAEANGEDTILSDGRRFCPPRGTLILYDEWYGGHVGKNEGLRMSSADVARGIVRMENASHDAGWIHPFHKKDKRFRHKTIIDDGIADGSIFNQIDVSHPSIAQTMEEEGVYFEPADKSPNSRTLGVQLMRDRLLNSIMFVTPEKPEDVNDAGPCIFVMEHCKAFIQLTPTLPMCEKNIDDVDTKAEDHGWDTCRYAILDCVEGGKSAKGGTFKGLTY